MNYEYEYRLPFHIFFVLTFASAVMKYSKEVSEELIKHDSEHLMYAPVKTVVDTSNTF